MQDVWKSIAVALGAIFLAVLTQWLAGAYDRGMSRTETEKLVADYVDRTPYSFTLERQAIIDAAKKSADAVEANARAIDRNTQAIETLVEESRSTIEERKRLITLIGDLLQDIRKNNQEKK